MYRLGKFVLFFFLLYLLLDNIQKENNTAYVSYSERNKGTHRK